MKRLFKQILLGLLGTGSTLAEVAIEVTMDEAGDFIQSPYNTVRNDSTGMLLATIEQGGGKGQALRKTQTSREGPFGLAFKLPPFEEQSGDSKDRLETLLFKQPQIDETIFESKFSTRIPSESDPVRGWFVIHQWHQSSPESPPISICLAEGHQARAEVWVRYGEKKGKDKRKRLKRLQTTESHFDLPLDQWSDWKVHWRLSPTDASKGLVDIYLDGTLLFSYRGILGYSAVESFSVSEKFGIYREKDPTGTHQIFYDSLSVTKLPKDFVLPSAATKPTKGKPKTETQK